MLDEIGSLVLVAAQNCSSNLRAQAVEVEPQAAKVEVASQNTALVAKVEGTAVDLLQAAAALPCFQQRVLQSHVMRCCLRINARLDQGQEPQDAN